jgi:hypothetical protein
MHYLTNYYKNLSEQLQEKVNFLETQLNEYLVRPGEKDGKKGTFYGAKFVSDEERKKSNPFPIPYNPVPKTEPRLTKETKPKRPGIQITPQRKPMIDPGSLYRPSPKNPNTSPLPFNDSILGRDPRLMGGGTVKMPGDSNLIGKVPMLGDTDAIDIMPKPDMDAINVMPKPDTNTINIIPQRTGYNIKKPKIKRFGDSGPKLPLAPIKPQGSQNQNTATNIDFRNYEPIKLRQNERGKFKG